MVSTSLLMPGQKTSWRSRRLVRSIPWWEAWRFRRVSHLRDGGLTILEALRTRPSSVQRSLRTFQFGLTRWSRRFGFAGKPEMTASHRTVYSGSSCGTARRSF